MKKFLSLLLILVLSFLFCACGNANGDSQSKGATMDEAVAATLPDAETPVTELKTPYVVLKYPAAYQKDIVTAVTGENPYTLAFRAKDGTALFTLIFNGKGEYLLGTITGENENVILYADIARLDEKSETYEEYSRYQESLGVITSHLKKDYGFIYNIAEEKEDTATFDIKTDVCTLKYPEKWKNKVSVDVDEKAARFSCGQVKLFDIVFSEEPGAVLLGTYSGTPVCVVSYTIDKTGLSKEESAELVSMQDDVNVIYDNLAADKNFEK